jgi:hypothetical protein
MAGLFRNKKYCWLVPEKPTNRVQNLKENFLGVGSDSLRQRILVIVVGILQNSI